MIKFKKKKLMAEISFDFRNVGSKKCAVSASGIVNLEIEDESPECVSKSAFQDFLFLNEVSRDDVKNSSNLNGGCEKQSDKNISVLSQSSLLTFTCNDHPSDKIKSTNDSDIDFDLLDLLNSAELGAKNFKSEKNISDNKMKIISNVEVCDDLSNVFSLISEKDQVDATFKDDRKRNSEDCQIDLLDFEFVKNECANSLSSNNSSLKVEGNMSDLLSTINFEDSVDIKGGNFISSSICNSKGANEFKIAQEPSISNLSDLLSSIDLGDSNGNGNINMCSIDTPVTRKEPSLTSLLSVDFDKPKKQSLKNEPCTANLSDFLASIDLGDSYDYKINNCNQDNMCKRDISTTKSEACLTSVLPLADIVKSDMPASAVLNCKPLSFGASTLDFKGINGTSDSPKNFTLDLKSNSFSSNSYSSSSSENSPKESLTEDYLLQNKVLKPDSGYNSSDSMPKDFSFFNFSSDNTFSFNTLLSNKSDDSNAMINCKNKDVRISNKEMSMSDLMNIVSPEFKSPILATLNNTTKLHGGVNVCEEKLMNCDCVDYPTTNNAQSGLKMDEFETDIYFEKDKKFIGEGEYVKSKDKIASNDEQISFIDLRECIKSTKHQPITKSPIKQIKGNKDQSSKHLSPIKTLFYSANESSALSQNKSSPYEFNNFVPTKKSRINTKQTLFSRALACKPKKDHSLLQKVADIKNELLKNIINRPVFIDCDVPQPLKENVLQTDKCILSNMDHKSFGLDVSCGLR